MRRKRRDGAPGRRGQEARKRARTSRFQRDELSKLRLVRCPGALEVLVRPGPAAAAAARRGLALYQLDMACFAAGRRGREVRRVDANPHDPSYDLILIMIVPIIAMAIALERYTARGLLVGAVKG